MIKFFRKFRKKLLSENKFSKYLIYAIGEILLVVIGILFALQINNWNEERKLSSQEHKILLALRSDFLESKDRLLQTMKMQRGVIQKSNTLILAHKGKIATPKIDSVKNYLAYGAFGWYRAELITGAYDALLNTGNSEIIKNRDLTRKLAEYFSILNSGFEDQETSMNLLIEMKKIIAPVMLSLTYPKLDKRIGLDLFSDSNTNEAIEFLMDQDAFFGLLYQKTLIEYLRYSIQKDLLVRIEEVLTIINEELKI